MLTKTAIFIYKVSFLIFPQEGKQTGFARARTNLGKSFVDWDNEPGDGHSRPRLVRDYPLKSPQSSVAPTHKMQVGGMLD
ncbi:hypothetical protein Hanom_Chr02g00135601 [Helianthus anomalus]